MKSFAFIVSPITMEQLKKYWPVFRIVPDFIARPALKKASTFKTLHLKKINSLQNNEISGHLIISPLTYSHPTESQNFIIDKFLGATRLAERLGADIVGFNSIIAAAVDKQPNAISKSVKLPLTTGSSLTAWSVFEAIYRVSRAKLKNLKKSTVTVIGAGNSVGSLSARKLAEYCQSLIMVDDNKEKLNKIRETITHLNSVEVTLAHDVDNAVSEADIVVNADIACENSLLDASRFKPEAIFCDIFYENDNFELAETRPDVTFIKAGLIKMPFEADVAVNSSLPENIIPAPLAETMLLTFEGKFVDYSLGEDVNLDKMEEIADIAAAHGFEVWVPEAPVL
ncbi:MAG: hypothetical protein AB1481_01165 [Candidatus Omnitrophota bacterium]